jgi:Acyl-CoA carboxylase epsilon subunit
VNAPPGNRPVLRVVRGNPTPEELAALVAVLAASATTGPLGADAGRPPTAPGSAWRSRAGSVRQPLPHGPDAWRASALPR